MQPGFKGVKQISPMRFLDFEPAHTVQDAQCSVDISLCPFMRAMDAIAGTSAPGHPTSIASLMAESRHGSASEICFHSTRLR